MHESSLVWIRRITQGLVLVVLLLSPFLQLVRTARQDPYPYPYSPVIQNHTSRQLLLGSDHFIRDLVDPVYENISGGPYTLKFFPISFSEPLTITNYVAKNVTDVGRWNWTLFFSLFIALGLALLFGRVYCGYICPMSLITSWNLKLQRRYFNRRPKYSSSLKFRFRKNPEIIFTAVLFLLIFSNPLFLQYLLPPSLFQHAVSDYLLFGGWTLWFTFILVLLVFEVLKPAYFCRRLCPTGTFLNFLGKTKKVHLHLAKGVDCTKGCKICLDECWLGLNPKTKIEDSACDLCVRCATHCPTKRIKFLSFLAPILLPLLMAFPGQDSFAGIWDNKESYHHQLTEITLDEGILSLQRKNEPPLTLLYAFYGHKGGKVDGPQDLSFFVHIRINKEEVFDKPITIKQFFRSKLVQETTLQTVTQPISIRKRSAYLYEFTYIRGQSMNFSIESPQGDFEAIEISFQHPKKRH